MPNYKTHSIHGELVFPKMDKKIEIDKEYLKVFCFGPDALIMTDYKTFSFQHANKTRDFFVSLIKIIKKRKLQNNEKVMAYLYGQIDHFVLDVVMHPLIYYMTEGMEEGFKIKPHGLVENWIDDYIIQKYDKNQVLYYHRWLIYNKQLLKVLEEVYKKVYDVDNEGIKYSIGMFANIIYDSLVRRNAIGIIPLISKVINLGDICYSNDVNRVLPYLNLNNELWYNPESGDMYRDSFDDLWKRSIEVSLETIEDVNKYLYKDKRLTNKLILDDISWNTGIGCREGQRLKYIKKYK